jgi:hypothetical protein
MKMKKTVTWLYYQHEEQEEEKKRVGTRGSKWKSLEDKFLVNAPKMVTPHLYNAVEDALSFFFLPFNTI